MFKVTTSIFISSFDLNKNAGCVVSSNPEIYEPLVLEIEQEDESVRSAAARVFEKYVSIGYDSIKIMLVDVLKKDNHINVFFACSIPPDTELKSGYYVNLNLALIDPISRKCLLYV
jgi:hypothetical protein